MRKKINRLLVVLISLILTGCLVHVIFSDVIENITNEVDFVYMMNNAHKYDRIRGSKTPRQFAVELYTEIIECLKNRDKEKLNGLFNDYYRNSLDADIDEAFDFIDGEIISCGEIEADGHIGSFYTYASYFADAYVITDKGTEYEIRIDGRLHDVEDPKRVGIKKISLRNKNKVIPARPYDWWEHWRDYKEYIFILGNPN